MQTSNILELLLSRKAQADLLAPLFAPNGCPDQFVHMYGSAAEVAVKDGASIAFSVLTKVGWEGQVGVGGVMVEHIFLMREGGDKCWWLDHLL